jgi:hypothetical protein
VSATGSSSDSDSNSDDDDEVRFEVSALLTERVEYESDIAAPELPASFVGRKQEVVRYVELSSLSSLSSSSECDDSEDDEEDKQPIQDIQSINEICKNSIDILNFLF